MSPSQLTIIIVEDCLEDRETYRRYLLTDSQSTYTILESEYGENGLELCRQVDPDAILLDFLLPDIDGLEFLTQLKTRVGGATIPIVMLTGQGNEAIAVQAMKSGASDYLVKGEITPESLRVAIHNVVEQTRLKRQLEHSETRFHTSVENMLDCFCIYSSVRDDSGNIIDFKVDYVNAAACAANKMNKEEQIGKRLLELLPYHRETKLFDDYCTVVESGNPLVIEVTVNGDILNNPSLPKTFDIRAAKLHDGVVAAWRDITSRKVAEEEIRKALAKEKELAELRNRFISLASHELRTPLSTIMSSAQLLEYYSHKWTEDKRLSLLKKIVSSVKQMTGLLNDVLAIGFAEAGKEEFNPEPLDLVQFCRELTQEMQLSAGNQHTIKFISGEGKDDDSLGSVIAWMDEKLLRHIFTNLLSNAIKYSPSGGAVYFKLEIEDQVALFQVQDSGIGIPPEDITRLFEFFHRAKNVGKIPGTGLGLAIAKNSVSLHGGTLAVESEVGRGTTFTVNLPLNYQEQKNNEQNFSH